MKSIITEANKDGADVWKAILEWRNSPTPEVPRQLLFAAFWNNPVNTSPSKSSQRNQQMDKVALYTDSKVVQDCQEANLNVSIFGE